MTSKYLVKKRWIENPNTNSYDLSPRHLNEIWYLEKCKVGDEQKKRRNNRRNQIILSGNPQNAQLERKLQVPGYFEPRHDRVSEMKEEAQSARAVEYTDCISAEE